MPYLPAELIIEIGDFCDDSDLASFRLASKDIYYAITPMFSKRNFSELNHVMSDFSFQTLSKITAHPIFASDVKAITIHTGCLIREDRTAGPLLRHRNAIEDYHEGLLFDDFVASRRCIRDLTQVFRNIKQCGNKLTIGISDCPPSAEARAGNQDLAYFGWRQLLTTSPKLEMASYLTDTLNITRSAIKTARCEINGLRIINHANTQFSDSSHRRPLAQAFGKFQGSEPLRLEICHGIKGHGQTTLEYDQNEKSLRLNHMDLRRWQRTDGHDCSQTVKFEFLGRLRLLHVRELHVYDCIVFEDDELRTLFLDPWRTSLEVVHFHRCKLEKSRDWVWLIRYLSGLPRLRSVTMKSLLSNVYEELGRIDRKYMVTIKHFKSEGDELSQELRDFAAQNSDDVRAFLDGRPLQNTQIDECGP